MNNMKINDRPIDILLVEDNEADIKITLRAFKKAKLHNNIFVVKDGQEALDFLYHEGEYRDKEKFPQPDLILLDIKMPKLDGFEVLGKLKNDAHFKSIPCIMLTSSEHEEDLTKSYHGGAAGYIPKPVNYEDFVKVVDGFNFYWHIINKLVADNTFFVY